MKQPIILVLDDKLRLRALRRTPVLDTRLPIIQPCICGGRLGRKFCTNCGTDTAAGYKASVLVNGAAA